MLSLLATACLMATTATLAPPVLTDAEPETRLRWRTLDLGRPTDVANARVFVFEAAPPVLLRVDGVVASCPVIVKRRFGSAGASADVALPVAREGARRIVVPPPVLGRAEPASGAASEDAPSATFVLEVGGTCTDTRPRVFQAERQDDPEGPLRIAEAVEALARADLGDAEAIAWARAPHAHRWQDAMADGAVVLRLLARVPGTDGALSGLRDALVARARRAAPLPEVGYTWHEPLAFSGVTREVPGEPEPSSVLAAGAPQIFELGDAEALRLHVRLPLDGEAGPAATRLELAFDERAVVTVPLLGGRDAGMPGLTRPRTLVVAVPVGARRVRIVSRDRAWLVRGERVWRKRHLAEVRPRFVVRPAAAPAGDVRWALTEALTSALLGGSATRGAGAVEAAAPGALGAWLVLERARLLSSPEALRSALDALDGMTAPRIDGRDALDVAAYAAVRRLGDDLRAGLELGAGNAVAGVRALVRAAATRTLCDEEAAWLADAEAFIPDEITLAGHALAAIDGALGRRPLDRALVAAHARAFVLGGQWRRLSPRRTGAEVDFLDGDGAAPGGRSRFSVVVSGGVDVDVPPSTPGRLSPLTLLTSPLSGVGARTVMVDGRALARLPPTTTFERYDLPLAAGRHRVTVTPDGPAFTNFATTATGAALLRRYGEVRDEPLTFQLAELGVSSAIQLSLRAAVRAPASLGGPVTLDLRTASGEHWEVPAQMTLAPIGEASPLPAPWRVTAAVTVVIPLSARTTSFTVGAPRRAGVRVFVSAAVRARRTLVASPPVVAADARRVLPRAGRAAPTTVDRARLLVAGDEPLLARETLLGIFEDPEARAEDLTTAAALWRELDESGSPLSSAPPNQPLSPALCLWPQDGRAAPDDAAALLDGLADARAAESTGDFARATARWATLAAARPRCAVLRRLAALTGLAADPGADAATRALVELATAAALDPTDAATARALKHARGRARLRSIPFAEMSAGSFLVQVPRGEATEADEPVVASWSRADHRAGVVGKERELALSFSVARPTRVALRVSPLELRPRAAEALRSAAVGLSWSHDGGPAATLPCPGEQECTTPPFDLSPGTHVVTARLVGGVRPAARLWVDDEGPVPMGLRRATFVSASGSAPRALATTVVAEYLAAMPASPIRLTVRGPAVLKLELRRRVDGDAGGARVESRPADGTDAAEVGVVFRRDVVLPLERDAEAGGPDVGPLSAPVVVEVPLALARPYTVEVSARAKLVLARFGVWEGAGDEAASAPPLTYLSRDPAPATAPLSLDAPPVVTSNDGDVGPGHDDVGSIGAWTAASHFSSDPEGAPVQTVTSLHLGATYRQLVDPLHTVFKGEVAERLNDRGPPSQALSASTFFIHPAHRGVRLGTDVDVRTQPVDGARAWSGRGALLIEPVVTLASGLHLVSKLSAWWSRRSLTDVSAATLPFVDPEVFSRYAAAHARGLALEEGLETEPFLNVVLYANVRATTNPDLRANDLDHVSTSLFARALFGRLYVEGFGRTTWFLPDATRTHATRHTWVGTRIFHTSWLSERQMIEIGTIAGYDFGTHAPEVSLSVAWEGSNGRRFRDHSAREGEDFFFAERGPGLGTSRLTVTP